MKAPMAPHLRELALAAGQDPLPLLDVREVFSEELSASPEFMRQVHEFMVSFPERGARATLARALGSS